MRGLVAATAVLGVIAIGGLPVLALTLADAETGSGDTATTAADGSPGPPAWAHGHGRDGKPGQPDGAKRDDGDDDTDGDGAEEDRPGENGQPGWARHGDQVPPGWAKQHGGRTPHGWAVREWAHCVADAAADLTEGEKLDPEAACGARPAPPAGSGRTR